LQIKKKFNILKTKKDIPKGTQHSLFCKAFKISTIIFHMSKAIYITLTQYLKNLTLTLTINGLTLASKLWVSIQALNINK